MSLHRTPFQYPLAVRLPVCSPPIPHSLPLSVSVYLECFLGLGPHGELTMSCVLRVHPCVVPLSLTWHTHTSLPPPLLLPFCCCCHCAFLSNVSVCLSAVKRALHTFRRTASAIFFHSCIIRQSQNRNRNSKVENLTSN